ncbi:hypothetical protein [Nocardia blacklockiae]|uniref:hypothetical protein n=1 Tax=Nocardia blacklockiae TaxID=480036 RepID=UPI0018938599|nr:hypothetical protein [Nocardia blacklockiae]MBF6170983.1 hypothetical protein [Nocardia blacklockiae]
MGRGTRGLVVAVAAAGLVGVVGAPNAAPAPAPSTPVSPSGQVSPSGAVSPTTPVPPCTSARNAAVAESCGTRHPDPTLDAPPETRSGTEVSVSGHYWRCETVQVTASWSGATRSPKVTAGSFGTSLPVDDRVVSGSYSITAACGRQSAAVGITIVRAEPSKTTERTSRATGPTRQATVPETTDVVPSVAQSPGDGPERGDNTVAVLAVLAFLLAVVVAALVLRRRRTVPRLPHTQHPAPDLPHAQHPAPGLPHPQDPAPDLTHPQHHAPRPPRVRVRVVGEAEPSVRVRELAAVPSVRVRLRAGETRIHVREVSR